jgi:hypothetical protein
MNLPELLIVTNEIRKGDVLLMHGGGKDAKAIAHFTGGEVSHAALCLGGSVIWESDGSIIGTKHMMYAGYCHRDGQQLLLATIPGDPQSCEVYRHEGMAEISEGKFMETFTAELRSFYGMNYSEYRRLLPMVKAGGLWKRLLSWVAWRRDRRAAGKMVHGPFCSELVACFYSRLGLPLFDVAEVPGEVTPLALAASKLKRVEGLVLNSKTLTITTDPENEFQDSAPLHLLDPETGEQVDVLALRANQIMLALRQAEEIRRKVSVQTAEQKAMFHESLGSLLEDFQRQGEDIQSHLKCCAVLMDNGTTRRAHRLVQRYVALAPEVHQLRSYAEQDHGRYQRTLRSIYALKLSKCRCEVLMSARIIRRNVATPVGWSGLISSWKFRRKRRETIRLFRKSRQLLLPLLEDEVL